MDDDTADKRCPVIKPDGTQCKGFRTQHGTCAGHAHLGATANPVEANRRSHEVRRQKAQERQEHQAARELTLQEALAARAVRERDALVDALFAGIAAEVEATRRSATAELILTRLLGKPREPATEAGTTMDEVRSMSSDDLAALRRQILDQHPHLRMVEGA